MNTEFESKRLRKYIVSKYLQTKNSQSDIDKC